MIKKIMKHFVAAFLAVTMLISGTVIQSPDRFITDRIMVYAAAAERSPEDALIEQALKYDGYTQKQMIRARGKDYRCAWCCYFVTDMARLKNLSYAIPYEGSCSSLFTTMTQEMGAKVVSTPRKGDLLFFFSTTEKVKPYIHIAIVAEANENSIRVIHGNYNNKVAVLNNTGFNDGNGNSTSGGTLKCVYVRPAYRKTKTDTNTCIQLKPGMNVQFVARCCTSCAIGSTASKTCGRVKLISKDNKAATTWKVCMSGNYFYFVNEKGYVLDAYGIRTAKCADMQIFKKRSKLKDTSLFTVKYEGDHCYLLFKDTPYCADCYGYNNWHEGTSLHCWNYKSNLSQQFKVVKAV